MARASGSGDASHQASLPNNCRGLCCPYCVLEIPHDASFDVVRASAESAVRKVQGSGDSGWILGMKLSAFAAIAEKEFGHERAWELCHEIQPIRLPFNIFVPRQADRVAPAPAPPTPPPPPPPPPPAALAVVPAADKDSSACGSVFPSGGSTGGLGTSSGSASQPISDAEPPSKKARKGSEGAPPEVKSKPSEESFYWQVKKGKKGKMKWGWVDEALNKHLERAFLNGEGETTFVSDGWKYYYDFGDMTQTSPGDAATERPIRRIKCDDDSTKEGRQSSGQASQFVAMAD